MVEANNLTRFRINTGFFEKIGEIVLKREGEGKGVLSVAFVSGKKMRELNKKYRKKNKPTDVLSFFQKNDFPGKVLGEVVLCPKVIKSNAAKNKVSFKREMSKALIHGVLHILGCEHEKSVKKAEFMKKKQEQYLSLFFK